MWHCRKFLTKSNKRMFQPLLSFSFLHAKPLHDIPHSLVNLVDCLTVLLAVSFDDTDQEWISKAQNKGWPNDLVWCALHIQWFCSSFVKVCTVEVLHTHFDPLPLDPASRYPPTPPPKTLAKLPTEALARFLWCCWQWSGRVCPLSV